MAKQVLRVSMFYFLLIWMPNFPVVAQSRPLVEFQHTAWTEQNGAPTQINALAQTKDGYLWLGTVTGLYRFDGVKFEQFQLPQRSIWSLAATDDGGLWIGYTRGETSFLKDSVLTNQSFRNKYMHGKGGTVFSILIRRDKTIWAATKTGPIKLESGVWHSAEEADGTQIGASYGFFEDSHKTLWMTTDEYVYRLPDGAQKFEKTTLYSGGNTSFSETADGVVWIADRFGVRDVAEPVMANGLYRKTIPVRDVAVAALFADEDGSLWVLGGKTGLTRISRPSEALKLVPAKNKTALENFSALNGLTSEDGNTILKDREGTLWIATTGGLDRFRRTALTPAPLPGKFGYFNLAPEPDGSLLIGTQFDGLQRLRHGQLEREATSQELEIPCIYRALDGKLWLGGTAKLGYLERGHFQDVPIPPEFKIGPWRETQAMTTGPDGDLWIQTDSKLGIFRLHHGGWSEIPDTREKRTQLLATDQAGRVWAASGDGYITIFDGSKKKNVDPIVGSILALSPDNHRMWIGGQRGLDVMVGDRPVGLKFASDTGIEGISGIVRTRDGALWLNTLSGVLRVAPEEVEEALKDPTHSMRYRLFDYLDGLSGKAPQIRPLNSIVRGVGSTLWFITTDGAVSINYAHIAMNTLAPPVSIKDVLVDGKSLQSAGSLTLPKGAKDLQIDYTALSLAIPGRVRFRYRLENYDRGWQDASTRRQAFYTHLPPGHYLFHVIACNNDGVWNETGAYVSLYLPPTFLQSWYFKALVGVVALVLLTLIYLLRLKQETTRMRARLQERFSERERIARELHDTLFQSVEGGLLLINSVTSRTSMDPVAKDKLQHAFTELNQVLASARSLIFNTTPLADSFELEDLVRNFGEQVGLLTISNFSVTSSGKKRDIRPLVFEELLKITKEALSNAFRHARARDIRVDIKHTHSSLEVTISDNGVGVDPEILAEGRRRGHGGMPGMQQRADSIGGSFRISSRLNEGTEVRITIPKAKAYRSPTIDFTARWFH